jgi:hypothetical protein
VYKTTIGSTEAIGSTFILYPRQIRIYLDQIYNQKTFNSDAITGTNSVKLSVQDIEYVFENAFGTLAYVNSANKYDYVATADSKKAFTAALTSNNVSVTTFLDISTPAGKTKFFKLLDDAINNLAPFGTVTQTTIGGTTPTPTPTTTPTPGGNCPTTAQVYPAGRDSYVSGTIVKASDSQFYKCNAGVAAWCNSHAEWAYAPATGAATTSAWTLQSCK